MEEVLSGYLANPVFLFLLVCWSMIWKGIGLWRAAKNDQQVWYVGMLLLNFFGVLEISYLVFFQKKDRWWEKIEKKIKL